MPGETESAPTRSLWRDRSFILFWLGRMVSVAGTTITQTVLPILVFQLTGSALLTSGLYALEVIPYILFGLFAGALADRVNRRRLMVVCDLINAALLASIPLAGAFNLLSVAQIYVVGLLSATAFVWFDAANFGAVPALVGKQQLIAANSAIWSVTSLLTIVIPGPAVLLATSIGAAPTISLDALSYLCSAAALLLIPRAMQSARAPADLSGTLIQRTVGDIREGLVFLWRHRLVRTMTLLGFGLSAVGGAVVGLLVVYGVRALGLTSTDPRLGLLFTAGAVGGLLTTVALPRLNRQFAPGKITLTGLCAAVLCLLAVTFAPSFIAGVFTVGLYEAAHTLVVNNGISLRQMVTPDHLQSRVNAAGRMIAWGGTPFGATLGGALAQVADVRLTYLIMAASLAGITLLGWYSPLREPLPASAAA